ncbi:MAG: pantoate--beta-alanine ligase [Chloroflexota bacterium]
MSPAPLLASTREELADLLAPRRGEGSPVALVPTMGALHDGHAALLRLARERAGRGAVVASIFVNPLQFAPGEDLDRYPRTLDVDLEICAREGVDVVFAPASGEVYPDGEPLVSVEPGPLAHLLEGESRPGHFGGVLTVVAKLFGLTRPDLAVFGEKDYQQLVLVRRMSRDLCLGVDVLAAPTVRESDGLALSSRNRFLDPADRRRAAVLSRALRAAQDRASYGVEAARGAAMSELGTEPDVEIEYLAIRRPDLAAVDGPGSDGSGEARILVAARVGGTRLIDNLPLLLGAEVGAEDPRVAR